MEHNPCRSAPGGSSLARLTPTSLLSSPLSAAVADAAMAQAQGTLAPDAVAEPLHQLQSGIQYDIITLAE